MKLSIPQPYLADALAKGGVVTARTVPIMACVRLIAKGDTLHIASTDGDRFAEVGTSAEIEADGAVCVDAVALSSLIARYPKDGTVALDLESPGLLRVKCGRSRVGLSVLPVVSFPDWSAPVKPSVFRIAGAVLADAFARMKPIASTANRTWEGTYIEPGEGVLNVCAFNGYAMSWLKLEQPEGAENAPAMILAGATVDTFTKLFKADGEVTIYASDEKVVFEAGGVRLASKLIVGNVPPYRKMLDVRGEKSIRFERKEFLICLERAKLATESEGALNVVTTFPADGGIELRTRNHKGGDASEPMDAEVDDGFSPVGFTPSDLAAILAGVMTDRVVVEEAVPGKRYLFSGDGDDAFMAAAAPIRLGA